MENQGGRQEKAENNFHLEWECEFFFTSMKDMCVYLICGSSVSVCKRGYVERNHTQVHSNFARDFPAGSTQRTEKVNQLKATLKKPQCLFIGPSKKANTATEASFKVAHILTKHKKPYTDGGMVKEVMTAVADTFFKDHKSKTEIMSAIADIQLGANTVAWRVSALSADAVGQLEQDMIRCKWFSIQCDELVDAADTAQMAVFVRMVFEDASSKNHHQRSRYLQRCEKVVRLK